MEQNIPDFLKDAFPGKIFVQDLLCNEAVKKLCIS